MPSESDMHSSYIFTIGHSNHAIEKFIDLVKSQKIEVIVDIRSHPYSSYTPHFTHDALEKLLGRANIRYLYLGDALGGRPEGDEFYDEDGRVLYWRLAKSGEFLGGLSRLGAGMSKYRVALMCSEEDPLQCHRHLLVCRVLEERGVRVMHIRGDGRLQTSDDLSKDSLRETNGLEQPTLFESEEDTWKSLQSVLQRRQPSNSSKS